MNPSKDSRPRRRRLQPAPDVLETRVVLSAGEGSTFAIMPGSVPGPGLIGETSFQISPSLFSTPKKDGKILIGIDITPAESTSSSSSTTDTSALQPYILGVKDSAGKMISVQHSTYDRQVMKKNDIKMATTSAVLVWLKVPKTGQPANDYTVDVRGLVATDGTYLVGFYLPGDVAGTGTVTQTDIKTIRSLRGVTADDPKYNFDADVNRDGVINGQDEKLAKEALGESTQVSPVVSVNLNPASDPDGNNTTPYSTVNFAGETTPNATVTFLDQASNVSTSTSTNSSGQYNIMVPLTTGSNTFTVTTQDGFGQSITGSISPVVYDPPSGTAPS
jgi:hypothetical protein